MTRFDITNNLIESPVAPHGDSDGATGADPSPALVADRTLIAVHAHEVEKGDILDGLALPVDSILTSGDGNWWYGSGGTFIAIRSSWGTIDVWREIAGVAMGPVECTLGRPATPAPSAANPDWANPHGIRRPLRAVPS